ncbi:MAG TPA: DUF1549 domain-containing protein, partial [Verrucomicrobiae bacterium]|nr:DUF1549 domain-containing protein [Verrucomicrobiae bacterium]
EEQVNRLLDSPRYGERMALEWLDAARYADTHGYHIDSARDMTRWRDWVINAYNANEPFDQFTLEQLAGDLLPNATLEQKIASGFNRNHMINFEGGAIAEEYETAYILDRVNTTSTVWLGLTMACSQCHDHKFDPITMKDYYGMYAFFNSISENGLDGSAGNAVPMLQLPSPEQKAKLDGLKSAVADAEASLKRVEEGLPAAQAKWEAEAIAKPAEQMEPAGLKLRFALDESLEGAAADGEVVKASWQEGEKAKWTDGRVGKGIKLDGEKEFVKTDATLNFDSGDSFSYGCWFKQTGKNGALIARMDEAKENRGFDLLMSDNKLYVHLINAWPENAIRVVTKKEIPRDRWMHVMATYDGSSKAAGVKIYLNGKEMELDVKDDKLSGPIRCETALNLGKRSASYPFRGSLDDARFYGRALSASEVVTLAEAPYVAIARIPEAERKDDQKLDLASYFKRNHSPEWVSGEAAVADAKRKRDEFDKTIPTTMVMSELEKPRDTFMLVRGQYDHKGDKVTPNTPASLPPMPKGAPANRLGLAKWLVSPEQPLTARVTVNRF